MATVETARGPVDVEALGGTLMHEHIFILNPELQQNYPNATWDPERFVGLACEQFRALKQRGIDTLVDLTVLGLGPDIRLIQAIARRLDFGFNIVLATGYYTYKDVAPYFRMHGPGRRVDMPEPLDAMFLRDIREGIGGTGIKAALIKIATDEYGFTPDLERVFAAAARVHLATGVPITTHTSAKVKGGLAQQDFLRQQGVDLRNVVIGHCGDTNDLDYLRAVADQGSTLGMDRFGIDSYNAPENRIATVAALCREGYADRMILSHDAAVFSVNTEPQHRARIFPNWHYAYVSDTVIPELRKLGVTEAQIRQMMVENPKRLLAPRQGMIVAGFDLRLSPLHRYVTVEDYRRAARRRLPDFVWAYLDGGAEDLVTLRANRTGFSAWALRARVLTAKGRPDLSTEVGGAKLDLPVMIAPTGYGGLAHWEGELCAMRAAEAAGTRLVLSTVSSWTIEEIARAATQEHGFQLYPREGDLTARLMERAWNAGYRNLFVTVDVPAVGLREGERRMGMSMPPSLTPARMLNIACHPRWAWQVLRHKRIAGRNLVNNGRLGDAAESLAMQIRHVVQARMGWDDLAWMRDQWKGRLYVKGVLDPGDAEKAVALGAEGIVVSNHGGRQLDHALSSIAALPAVAAAVGGRAEILLDSGVRRGTDVVKALALGAKAVLIGRPYIYGMAVAGQAGVAHVLEIFRSEMERTLQLMGVGSVRELDPSWLIPRNGRPDDSADPSTAFDPAVRPYPPGP